MNSYHHLKKILKEERKSVTGARVAFIALSFALAFGVALSLLLPRIETQAWLPGYDWLDQPAMLIWFESDPPMV